MKIALYIGIAGIVLAIVYYFWHVSRRKAATGETGARKKTPAEMREVEKKKALTNQRLERLPRFLRRQKK